MSADNWAICPRCRKRAYKAEAETIAAVTASYGKIPAAEYQQARDAIQPVDLENLRTFREDYEIYGAEDGTINVSYSGGCRVCGLGESFQEQHPMEVGD